MNSKIEGTIGQMLVFGLILAAIKLVYLFFDNYNILDFVVFLAAGILLGGKNPSRRWLSGIMMALPAFTLCLSFLIVNGYSSIVNGVGTSYAVSLIIIPLATFIGIFINAKHALRKSSRNK
jgi:hypothetical protein